MTRHLLSLIAICAFSSTALAEPPPSVDKIIEQLGDDNFSVRSKAMKALEQLNPDALPKLREALKKTQDPEVRKRLQEVIPQLEVRGVLAPTRVTLSVKDKPLRDVVKEFSRVSGYAIQVWPDFPNNADPRAKKSVSLELKDVPFWEAIDKLCEAAGLSVQEHMGDEGIQLQLYGDSSGIKRNHDAFRIKLSGLSYNRSVQYTAQGTVTRHESLSGSLAIGAEPKIFVLGTGQPTITEAVDERDQSLRPPPPPREFHDHFHHRHGLFDHVALSLNPVGGSKRLKVFRGTIPIRIVSEQTPRLTIENLVAAKGKSFKENDCLITVDEVKQQQAGYVTVNVTMSDKRAGQDDGTAFLNTMQRMTLTDEKGVKWRNYGSGGGNVGGTFKGNLTFGHPSHGRGIAQPVAPNPRLKLVYYDWKIITHKVPFEFKDLELP